MSIKESIEQMQEAEDNLKLGMIHDDLKCFGLARMGFDDQKIVSGTLKEFLDIDMGKPLHSFVICHDKMHMEELEMYEFYN